MNSLEALENIAKRLADVPYQEEIDSIEKDLEKLQAIENKGLKYEDDILSFEDNQGRRLVVNDTLVDYYVKYSAIENADLSKTDWFITELERGLKVGYWQKSLLPKLENHLKKAKAMEEKNKQLNQILKLLKINFELRNEYEGKKINLFTAQELEENYYHIKRLDHAIQSLLGLGGE